MLSTLAGCALPLSIIAVPEVFPPPWTWFVRLLATSIFIVPFLSLALTCWFAPAAWHGSVLVRLLACSFLASATLAAAAGTVWTVNALSSTRSIQTVSTEMIPGVAALVLGMAVVGCVQQLWFGWNLCELGIELAQIPATSIRQLMELTAGAGVVYALFAASFQEPSAMLPYVVTALYGTFLGAVCWLRLKALSPRRTTRRRSRFWAVMLVFAGWYALVAISFYQDEEGWRFYDWRSLSISAASATLFLVSSSLPLIWLRRQGWVLLRRGTARAANGRAQQARAETDPAN